MARYINADEALRISKEGRFMWAYDLTDLEEFLTNVPSVDAVEVVRCKDCKEGEPMLNGCVVCTRRAYKSRGLMFWGTQMLPDDYCSYGKRKVHDDGRT